MPQKNPRLSPADWRRRFQQQADWTRNLRQYLYPRAGLEDSQRLLEVGCGPGVILDEIETQFRVSQEGQANLDQTRRPDLFGLDIRLDTLQAYARENSSARLTQGDAHHLPYADGSFDLVICHFLLLWVNDPLQAVREMRRVCSPGGSVLALAEPDYGGRLDYPAELEALGALQTQALMQQGAEAHIGRKLGWLFSQAGLVQIETGVLGGQRRGIPSAENWELEWQVLADDLDEAIPRQTLKRLQAIDRQAYQSGSRTLFVPTFYAWGLRDTRGSRQSPGPSVNS